MSNTQLAAFLVGVAITVVVVGAVLTILFALRGFRNNRTTGGLYPAFDSTGDRPSRDAIEDITVEEPAPYRVVRWTPPGTATPAPLRTVQPAPVAVATSGAPDTVVVSTMPPPPVVIHTEGDVSVVTSEHPTEIVLDEPEHSES